MDSAGHAASLFRECTKPSKEETGPLHSFRLKKEESMVYSVLVDLYQLRTFNQLRVWRMIFQIL